LDLPNEKSLHSAIRSWYSLPEDRFEVKIDDFVIDIVRDHLLIEIQTKNFSAIRKKLRSLVKKHEVLLVYPLPLRKWIVRVTRRSGEVISRRKSPKTGRITDLFYELMRIPDLVNEENFSLEVLMIEEEEIWCDDGKGSWRRRGASIKDKKLISVLGRARFKGKADFLRLLPSNLPQPLTNKSLAKCLRIPVRQSRRMTYSLRKMGAMREAGKNGRELLFEIVP
jgi:hypothetical protein